MWEQIRANKRKAVVLVVTTAALLIALGYAIGYAEGGPNGARLGVAVAAIIWAIQYLIAFAGGDSIMLATAGARRIEKADMPRLFNVVDEMTIAAGLPRMPEVYLVDSDIPNAFAVGSPKRSAVAVTTGLLSRLNRDELQGVVAHEIGHIRNYDTYFMVLVGVMVGTIVLISDAFLRGLRHGAFGRRGRSSGGGGQAAAIMFLVAIVLAILSPILAQLLYFACSRRREYLADASGARFTRYPEGLASALEKIQAMASQMQSVNRVLAPMYIVNPLTSRAFSLFSTHPATDERIRILRSMAGGADYRTYEKAYRKIHSGIGLVGENTLVAEKGVAIRPPSAEPEPPPAQRKREARDAAYRAAGWWFAECACGTRIKVPPSHRLSTLDCPSCGSSIDVAPAKEFVAPAENLRPVRMRLEASHTWRTIKCPCGAAIQISPEFIARHIRCRSCGQPIEVDMQA